MCAWVRLLSVSFFLLFSLFLFLYVQSFFLSSVASSGDCLNRQLLTKLSNYIHIDRRPPFGGEALDFFAFPFTGSPLPNGRVDGVRSPNLVAVRNSSFSISQIKLLISLNFWFCKIVYQLYMNHILDINYFDWMVPNGAQPGRYSANLPFTLDQLSCFAWCCYGCNLQKSKSYAAYLQDAEPSPSWLAIAVCLVPHMLDAVE